MIIGHLHSQAFSKLDEGPPRIHTSATLDHKPINIINPVCGIGPEKLLS
jgi:hypothetical protein